MSRILVDLPDSQVKDLAAIVEAEHRPRAAVIRDAIEAYISQHKRVHGADVFGLWKKKIWTVLPTSRSYDPNGKGTL